MEFWGSKRCVCLFHVLSLVVGNFKNDLLHGEYLDVKASGGWRRSVYKEGKERKCKSNLGGRRVLEEEVLVS